MLSLSYQILIFPCHIFYQPPSFINRDSPTKAMNAKEFLILIHAPHARSDRGCQGHWEGRDISIHAPHARSDFWNRVQNHQPPISIHAPHARSDGARLSVKKNLIISIHAPHARSDLSPQAENLPNPYFNPRSSCEERPWTLSSRCFLMDFNPRSSCEERQ